MQKKTPLNIYTLFSGEKKNQKNIGACQGKICHHDASVFDHFQGFSMWLLGLLAKLKQYLGPIKTHEQWDLILNSIDLIIRQKKETIRINKGKN